MKLTRLIGKAVKGQTFDHELKSVTAFVGNNFAGKTSRINALNLVLAGYDPSLRNASGQAVKQPREVWERLASDRKMGVACETDNGPKLARYWEMVNSSVKYDGVATAEFQMPEGVLDAGEYLAKSGPERLRFMFARAKLPAEFTVESLFRQVAANIKNTRLEENTEASEAAIAGVLDAVSKVSRAQPVQAWVAAVAAALADAKRAADQNVKRLAQTTQGLTQVRSESPANAGAEAAYRKATEEASAAGQALHGLRVQYKQCEEQVKEAQAAAQRVLGEAGLLEQEAKCRSEVERLKAAEPKAVGDCPDIEPIRDEQAKCAREYSKTGNQTQIIAQEIAETKATKVCSKCGQSMAKLKKKVLAALESKMAEAKLADEEAIKAYEVADKKLKAARINVADWEEASKAYRQWQHQLRGVQDSLGRVVDELNRSRSDHDKAGCLSSLTNRLSDLMDKGVAAKSDLDFKEQAKTKAEDGYKALLKERADAASRAAVVAEQSKAKAEAQVLKAACETLSDLQGKLVELAVQPFVAAANRLCGAVLTAPIVFQDGELGLLRGGKAKKIQEPDISGVENALCRCALAVALAQDSPLRVVIIDEFSRLDDANREKMANHLCDLCAAGELDNAFIIDVRPVPCKRDNFLEVRL